MALSLAATIGLGFYARGAGASSRRAAARVLRAPGPPGRVDQTAARRTMAKGQIKNDKSNKPKLSPKEKKAKKKEKALKKG
jgi:hypothetical protein